MNTETKKEIPFRDRFNDKQCFSFKVAFSNTIKFGENHKFTYISECKKFAMKATNIKEWCDRFDHLCLVEERAWWNVTIVRIGESEPYSDIFNFKDLKWIKNKEFNPPDRHFIFSYEVKHKS